MPSIGRHWYELRVRDAGQNWRIVYRVDEDAVVIAEVSAKKTDEPNFAKEGEAATEKPIVRRRRPASWGVTAWIWL